MKRLLLIASMLILFVSATVHADDTAIYGTASVSIEPNVLIIFDTSGSMSTEDVYAVLYDPNTTYAGNYPPTKVYRKSWWGWSDFVSNVDNIVCTEIKDELLANGYAVGKIKSDTTCGGWSTRTLRTGNYRNYETIEGASSRISVAQTVVKSLIDDSENIRFALMRFNSSQGGRIVAEWNDGIDDSANKNALTSAVDALTADGWTPLAETLAEAGLFYAGMASWFNSGTTYTSPMIARCQKNYVILMTDGDPTQDNDSKLYSGSYINGDVIGDYDGDGKESSSQDYLDDVAKYLYENDCNPALGEGTSFHKQNIITYTIGFKTQQQLLEDTAANGGGKYFVANNVSGLLEAFEEIMANISEENAVFVAPVVPVSRMNRTFSGDRIYIGFFRPMQSGRWLGNIKKYGIGDHGELLDADGVEATNPDGSIKDNARSYWSSVADGPNVAAGGIGEVLVERATSRNIYTYLGDANLYEAANAFTIDNADITATTLDVDTAADKDNLINEVRAEDRFWIMGDILHSQPTIAHYSDDTYIFAGSNDGMLHCFKDSDGEEMWGFIPPGQLQRLQLLLNNDHDYFVDGAPVMYEISGQKILFFGERRGGNHYYALDISTVTEPKYLYDITHTIVGSEELGQSWSRPEISEIMTSADTSETILLMGGGYDNNQDNEVPAAVDSKGRAVFAVNATDGVLINSLNFNAVDNPTLGMTHSIVDVSGFNTTGDEYTNRIYAGDLGGNVFALRDDDDNGDLDGTWEARKLFSASAVDGVQRKIFYAPDAISMKFGEYVGEYVYFGTGDRADPVEADVVNRVYAVKNNWADINDFTTITEDDLVDLTYNPIQNGTEAQKAQALSDLETKKGWYIKFILPGEKMTASPLVFGGVVYFTTYTPDTSGGGGGGDDPCESSEVKGTARLYEVNYLTAGGTDPENSPETEYIIEDSGTVTGTQTGSELGIHDRSRIIGSAIPSAPVIAILESGAKIYIGIEGGVTAEDPTATVDLNLFYWRQIF